MTFVGPSDMLPPPLQPPPKATATAAAALFRASRWRRLRAFQRILTAFSVLPVRCFAMSAHRLPTFPCGIYRESSLNRLLPCAENRGLSLISGVGQTILLLLRTTDYSSGTRHRKGAKDERPWGLGQDASRLQFDTIDTTGRCHVNTASCVHQMSSDTPLPMAFLLPPRHTSLAALYIPAPPIGAHLQ